MSRLSRAVRNLLSHLHRKKTIEISPCGRLGNQMFQYLLARRIQLKVPDAVITGYNIPEFGLRGQEADGEPSNFYITTHAFDFDEAIRTLRDTRVAKITITGLSIRMEHFANHLDLARKIFPTNQSLRNGFGDNYLVIHIRLGDTIIPGVHANYRPMPIAWYERIISESGKMPVFIGEIGNDQYSEELKRRFQNATFISSSNPMDAFNMLRTSRNIVLSVSTFAWLAAWLSETANQITLPISGIFNPKERPDIDAIPVDDPRYRFNTFPVEEWRGSPEQLNEKIFGPDTSSSGLSNRQIEAL